MISPVFLKIFRFSTRGGDGTAAHTGGNIFVPWRNSAAFLFLFAFFIMGCNESMIVDPPPSVETTNALLILNEGLYGLNNSDITYYNVKTGETIQNYYAAYNEGAPLGDTGNDIVVRNDKIYVCVDKSNKVEIINLESGKSEGFIDLGSNGSPRCIAFVNDSIAYVTSVYSDKVIKCNVNAKTVLNRITVGAKPEGILYTNGKLFIANSGYSMDSTITVIDQATDAVLGSIEVAVNPRFLYLMENGNIAAVCAGSYDATGAGGVFIISPASQTVLDSVTVNANPYKAALLPLNKMAVITNTGIALVNLSTVTVENPQLVQGMTVNPVFGTIWSIAYDGDTERLYCSNPKSFDQAGEIVVLDVNGNEQSRIPAGINPGAIAIVKKAQ